jgi:hypothetical protein
MYSNRYNFVRIISAGSYYRLSEMKGLRNKGRQTFNQAVAPTCVMKLLYDTYDQFNLSL